MKDRELILSQLESLMTGYWLTDTANFSAYLFHEIYDLNWIGFYFSDGTKLRLGPFAGKPACTEIAFERGVCGTAFRSRQTVRVADVHEFPGHIACDPNSRSELVIPFFAVDPLIGVLDVDSPKMNRFSEEDTKFFQSALQILIKKNAKP